MSLNVDVPRLLGLLVLYLVVGSLLGGALSAVADMTIGTAISGTVLGPEHGQTATAWSIIGMVIVGGIHRGVSG